LESLREAGLQVDVAPFFDDKGWDVLYRPRHLPRKVWAVVSGFFRRLRSVARAGSYDYIFLYREAAPLGPPVFEALLFLLGKPVVYDFDDAIFLRMKSDVNALAAWLKWPSKVAYITRRSRKISVCNPFLVDWAKQYNQNVTLIPTSIDPTYHRPLPKKHSGRVVIGWTGTHTTMPYLEIVRPSLQKLQQEFDFDFRVICNVDPGFPELRNYQYVRWKLECEIEDLNEIDIGLMPVPEGTWGKGKVGFKAIQYSAMEIVPVVSDTGSGHEVVQHGETGFVVLNTEEAWTNALSGLLRDPQSIPRFGRAAREYILRQYSVPALKPRYKELFA
jgi:glycosyltransferase involved in cell wall biosynthesis